MSRRGGLAAFQEHLSRRLAEAQAAEVQHAHLGLSAGAKRWLVDIADAQELLPVTEIVHVPLTQRWFRGLVAVRGDLLGVVDVGGCLTGISTTLTPGARILLPHARYGMQVALLFAKSLGLKDPREFRYLDGTEFGGMAAERWEDAKAKHWLRFDMTRFAADSRFANAALDDASRGH